MVLHNCKADLEAQSEDEVKRVVELLTDHGIATEHQSGLISKPNLTTCFREFKNLLRRHGYRRVLKVTSRFSVEEGNELFAVYNPRDVKLEEAEAKLAEHARRWRRP
jgi:hypothetical protein